MKTTLIVFMATTCGLAIALAAVIAHGQQLPEGVAQMEEITPAEYEQATGGVSIREETSGVTIFAPSVLFGTSDSPADMIGKQKELTVKGQSAEFGGFESAIISGVSKGTVILYVLGGLCIVAGIVCAVWLKRVVLGLAVAGGGIGLMAVAVLFETYPWIVLVGAVVLLGGLVWFLYDSWKGGRLSAALKAVVTGVEAAPAEAQAPVKASIGQVATSTGVASVVKAEVSKLK